MRVWDQELLHLQLMLTKEENSFLIKDEKVEEVECIINFQFLRQLAARQLDQQLDRLQSSQTKLQLREQLQLLKPLICKPRAPGQKRRARFSETKKLSMKRKLNRKGTSKTQEDSQL